MRCNNLITISNNANSYDAQKILEEREKNAQHIRQVESKGKILRQLSDFLMISPNESEKKIENSVAKERKTLDSA